LRTGDEDRMILVGENKVSEVICLACYRRWVAARPIETRLNFLECPCCHTQGFAIETGETKFVEDLLIQANSQ
jgi:Zn finger protein HypA/HybF involved in hydrogenase expression